MYIPLHTLVYWPVRHTCVNFKEISRLIRTSDLLENPIGSKLAEHSWKMGILDFCCHFIKETNTFLCSCLHEVDFESRKGSWSKNGAKCRLSKCLIRLITMVVVLLVDGLRTEIRFVNKAETGSEVVSLVSYGPVLSESLSPTSKNRGYLHCYWASFLNVSKTIQGFRPLVEFATPTNV